MRKGEEPTTIFFTKPYEVEDEDADDGKKTIRVLKHYAVFHASQIDALPTYKAPGVEEAPWTRPEAADIILRNSRAMIRIGGDRAFYSPATDHMQLPPEPAFRGPPEFAATALHELGHSSRLNRDMQARFGWRGYAMEELRAELASAFIAIIFVCNWKSLGKIHSFLAVSKPFGPYLDLTPRPSRTALDRPRMKNQHIESCGPLQTAQNLLQVLVLAREWRFKSSHPHQINQQFTKEKTIRKGSSARQG